MRIATVKTRLYSVYDLVAANAPASGIVQGNLEAKKEVASSTPAVPRTEEAFSRTLTISDVEFTVDFVVVKLDRSAFVWCGVRQGAPRLDSLALAMCLDKSKSPVSTAILGGTSIAASEDEASAARLAKKTGLVAVHFSSNFGLNQDLSLRSFAEREIIAALK